MKNLVNIAVGVVVFASGMVYAQDPTVVVVDPEPDFRKGLIGVRFMPTVSSFNVRTSDNVTVADFTLGYGVGFVLGANFNKNVGVQAEVQYNRLTQKYKDQQLDRRVDIDYVNIPLLFSLNTNRMGPVNLNLVLGPQIGLNAGATLRTTGTSDEGTDFRAVLAVKGHDFGFAYGIGLDFALNSERTTRLDLGFRGVQGMVNISDRSRTLETNSYYVLEKSYIQTYAIYAGLTFLIF